MSQRRKRDAAANLRKTAENDNEEEPYTQKIHLSRTRKGYYDEEPTCPGKRGGLMK